MLKSVEVVLLDNNPERGAKASEFLAANGLPMPFVDNVDAILKLLQTELHVLIILVFLDCLGGSFTKFASLMQVLRVVFLFFCTVSVVRSRAVLLILDFV